MRTDEDYYIAMLLEANTKIAELEAKLDHMSNLATPASSTIYENIRLREKVTELERKLAEQQARVKWLMDRYHFDALDDIEELNNLLAKAKEEERNECAKVCSNRAEAAKVANSMEEFYEAEECEYAILERSNAPKPQGETE